MTQHSVSLQCVDREQKQVLEAYSYSWLGALMLISWASLVAQLVKNPPAMQETWVRTLGWEDPLEKEKATHSSILAWRIPWTEEPGRLWSMGHTELDMSEQLTFSLLCVL